MLPSIGVPNVSETETLNVACSTLENNNIVEQQNEHSCEHNYSKEMTLKGNKSEMYHIMVRQKLFTQFSRMKHY